MKSDKTYALGLKDQDIDMLEKRNDFLMKQSEGDQQQIISMKI